jgi:photosystem II stability/assembly factor-like uncharacterized protein
MKKIIFITISVFISSAIFGQYQWIPQISGTNQIISSVSFPSLDTGYFCITTGDIYKSINGGQTWNLVGNGPTNTIIFTSNNIGFGISENQSFILKTVDGGVTWNNCYNDSFMEIWSLCFADTKHGYAVTLGQNAYNYILKTSNGGIQWDTVSSYFGLDMYKSIYFRDSLNGFIGGWMGHIFKSTDGGLSWIANPVDTINLDAFYSIHFPTADTGYVGAESNHVFRTFDGGDTWTPFIVPSGENGSIHFINADTGFVVGLGGLFKTTDAGSTWVQDYSTSLSMNCLSFPSSTEGIAVGSNGTVLKYMWFTGMVNSRSSQLRINPNPTKDKITVELSSIDSQQINQYYIYNIHGQCILNQELKNIKTEIDLSDLTSGIYTIKICTSNDSFVRKILKE